MKSMLTSFFQNLFLDTSREILPSWVYAELSSSALDGLPQLDGFLVRSAVHRLQKHKTCAKDMLVAEMLHELDDDAFSLLADIFRVRILNRSPCAEDVAWNGHLVTLLRKKGFRNHVRDFRPIAVLPVLFKVYSLVLLALTEQRLDNLTASQFAFRSHFQGHEVIFILRNLIEKSIEWDRPVFVLDGDLSKAYDYTRHTVIISALEAKGVPQIVIAAWVRELRRCSATCVLDGGVASEPVRRTRSLLRGGSVGPSNV